MVIYSIYQIIYSMNQISLGDMNMKNILGQPPQPARRQQGQLISKCPSPSGKYEKKDQQLLLWAGTSNSSRTGPYHQRVEKHQLTLKGVKENIK